MSQDPIRCPYCIYGDNFQLMVELFDGKWFTCEKCGHIVMPDRPSFVCACQKYRELFRPLKDYDGVA